MPFRVHLTLLNLFASAALAQLPICPLSRVNPGDSAIVREFLDANGHDSLAVCKVITFVGAPKDSSHVEALRLVDLSLDSFPPSFARLALRELVMIRNGLKSIPDFLADMPFGVLMVSENRLQAIPIKILTENKFRGFRYTDLIFSRNQIHSLPDEVGSIKTRVLNVSGNQLRELPKTLLANDSIRFLNLDSNSLCALDSAETAALNARWGNSWEATQVCPTVSSRSSSALMRGRRVHKRNDALGRRNRVKEGTKAAIPLYPGL